MAMAAAKCGAVRAAGQAPCLARALPPARPVAVAVASRAPIAFGPRPAAALAAPGRAGTVLRVARVQETQRVAGNRAAQRLVQSIDATTLQRLPGSSHATAPGATWIQRDAAPSAAAANGVAGDAAAQQAQVTREASMQAAGMDERAGAAAAALQGQADTRGQALQGDAAAKGASFGQQSATAGAALQGHAGAQGARLGGESALHGARLQQDASSESARLEGVLGTLETSARATETSTRVALDAEASGMQGEAEASAGAVQDRWGGFESQTTKHAQGMTARTQALMDDKTALVREYESPGAHDPEQFHRRWATLQARVAPIEQEQSELARTEGAGEAITERAGTLWNALTNRGRSMVDRVSGVAGSAWNAVQGGWSALQGAAAGALAGLRSKAAGAVDGLKSLATSAWTGLQGAATQAWTGLQGAATGALAGLQAQATAAWTGLQAQAAAAWTGLQGVASAVVAGLSSTIGSIVSRISGAVSRIIDAITGALGAVVERLRSATAGALDFLKARAAAAWGSVKSLGTRAWEGLKSLSSRAWEGARDLGTRAWDGLKNLGTRAWQGLKDLGTRAWNGLKDLGQRAWDGLKSGWDWMKKKAQAAWNWLKGAWEAVKRKAALAWDWIKRRAKEALAWLKKKWLALKALVARAWAWLKAKWKWLKEWVKITIRIPDQTLCKLHNFKPWKFVDIKGGRLPIIKTVVDPGIGPIELALFVQANAEATIGGTIGPCTLKNIAFTLQPLVSRYSGQADFHVSGSAVETLKFTGTVGGTANYFGLIGLVGGGLEGGGSATALATFGAKPRFVYDSGKLSASLPVEFEFCLMPSIALGAFVTAKLIAGQPPAAAKPAPSPPLLPAPGGVPQIAGGCWKGGQDPRQVAVTTPGAKKPPDEEVLKEWTRRWHLGSWTKRECWRLGARFQLVAGAGGMPDFDVKFDAAPVSIADVIRDMFDRAPLPGAGGKGQGGGSPDEPGILKTVTASGRCKCVGEDKCGGGKMYEVCYTTQKDCKKSQKDLDDFCNNNSEMKAKCSRPKCYYRHSDPCCPDDCPPGEIKPLEVEPVGPLAACHPVTPAGSPTVNNPSGSNDCTPDMPRPDWNVIDVDPANWGVCVTALPLSGTINIKPWPSIPNSMVVKNTANPQDGGNIENKPGSRNHWQFAIDDMADYDSTTNGGAGAFWHATSASEAHEWAHWNLDFKRDALPSAAGGDWARTNAELNALREPKSASSTPAAAKAALQPRVDARVATFRTDVVKRWNQIIGTTDSPGKGGNGYAAGMAVLNQYIVRVRNYKNQKGW